MSTYPAAAGKTLSWRKAFKYCWLPFLLSRLWVAAFVYLGQATYPADDRLSGSYAGVSNWWLRAWTVYDSEHFLSIAQQGYTARTTPFFPFYPWLMRPFRFDENAMALAGIVISNVCFWGMLAALLRLTSWEWNQEIGRRAIWILAFFPISAVFSAVYTESLFGVFLITAFLCAQRQHWLWAGVLATLAALTRNSGALIFLALAVFWWQQRPQVSNDSHSSPHKQQQWRNAAAIWPIVFPLLAFCAVQFWFSLRFGGLAGVAGQKNYLRAPSAPWSAIVRDTSSLFNGIFSGNGDLMLALNLAATLLGLIFVAVLWKKQMYAYSILIAGILAMHLTLSRTVPPYTNGSLRYMAGTFPFVQCLAAGATDISKHRLREVLALGVCLILNLMVSFSFGARMFVTG